MRLPNGEYKYDNGRVKRSLFRDIKYRVLSLVFMVSLGVVIEYFLSNKYAISFPPLYSVLLILYCSTLFILLLDSHYYNQEYPKKKDFDPFFLSMSFFLCMLNFWIPFFPKIEDQSFMLYTIRVNFINLILGVLLFVYAITKMLRYALKVKKEDKTSKRKPVLIFYFSSSITIALNSFSFYNIIETILIFAFVLHFLLSLLLLSIYYFKKVLFKIKVKLKYIFNKKRRYGLLIFSILFGCLTVYYIIRLFTYSFIAFQSVGEYLKMGNVFKKNLYANSSIYKRIASVWNFPTLCILLGVFIFILICYFIRKYKGEQPLFDWENKIIDKELD